MFKTLLTRAGLVVAAAALVGVLIGVVAALVLTGSSERYAAHATLAMLPGPDVSTNDVPNVWEVLSRGQATRTAAIVLAEERWLPAAAAAAGVDQDQLSSTAGALPDTTLVELTVHADSASAAKTALASVVTAASPEAAASSGPFTLQVVSAPDGDVTSLSPGRGQAFAAFALAGLVLGAGVGLLLTRVLGRRQPVAVVPGAETNGYRAAAVDSGTGGVHTGHRKRSEP